MRVQVGVSSLHTEANSHCGTGNGATIYRFTSDFPDLEKLLRGRINIKVIQENFDDVLRLTHSIREGKVCGSLIMGKLGSYARQNKLATALRGMGRIEKPIFILDYISTEALRRRIQRASALNIIINAVSVWNAVYLTEATRLLKGKGSF